MTAGLVAAAVTRTFPGGAGVHGVDIAVRPGEIHALVGLNGAGKTTLMRLLLGMLRPDAGTITVDGMPLRTLPPAVWARVGQVSESVPAYGDLTTRENLVLFARLHGLARGAAAAAAAAAMDEFAISPYADVRARRLSSGNRQRLALAAALQHDPHVVVLDEPTNTLDPAGVVLLRESLRVRCSRGAAILVSSHHLDEVARIADRISVVNAGRVIGTLDPGGLELERSFFALVLADDESRNRT